MMFKAEMIAPCGLDCNICSQALIVHNPCPGCNNDFWEFEDAVIRDPKPYFSEDVCKSITPIIQKTWKSLGQERKKLFQLLCRFSLNLNQASVLYNQGQREKKHII